MNDSLHTVLYFDKVHYRYPSTKTAALKTLNLTIQKGSFVALMGRTGGGKTTLLSLSNGLIPEFFEGNLQGDIITDGLSTRENRISRLVRNVGIVFQDAESQILGSTVEKDVAIGPCNLGFTKEKVLANSQRFINAMGLNGLEQRSTPHLSGGEKQRVAIAGVLSMEPSILLLDEPTSELDPSGRTEMFRLLSNLRSAFHCTIVIATHDSEEVLTFADRVIVLDKGCIVFDDTPVRLFSDYEICQQNGIRLPIVAEIMNKISYSTNNSPLPLQYDDAVTYLKPLKKRIINSPAPASQNPKLKTQPIIEIQNLIHSYQGKHNAIKGISLTIHRGEFVALVGKNGVGKTTLVKHLNGLLQPTSGTVNINGIDTRKVSISELSHSVGYVFQNPDHQIFCSSVYEEVSFGIRQSLQLNETEISERVYKALEIVELQNVINQHPFKLGKGERQKLAIACVLAQKPDVLVIDEPTTGLDWEGIVKMMDMITSLNSQGHTIIFITHDLQLVADYASRIILLRDGTCIADDSPEVILKDESILLQAGLTPPPIVQFVKSLRTAGISVDCIKTRTLKQQLSEMLN